MKKTKSILLTLAALSTVAFAAVGCNNVNPPDDVNPPPVTPGKPTDPGDPSTPVTPPADDCEHVYAWVSDGQWHWEKCGKCNGENTESKAAHVDVLVNSTKAEGEDGHCDVCDHLLQKTVTFDLNGSGGNVPPPMQKVDFGTAAVAPTAPTDAELKFYGWYTDAECSDGNEYDFDTEVTTSFTLYAKWGEDNTPGASEKYAIALTANSMKLQAFGDNGLLYYSFTAPESGRYELKMASAVNSQKCRFTTDQDDDTYYGAGCSSASKYFNLEKGETIVIIVSCEVDLADTAQVSPMVNDNVNEPLPEDRFLSGEYVNASYNLVLSRENNNITLLNVACPFTYVGGNDDTLYFTRTMSIPGFTQTDDYQLKYDAATGNYVLSWGSKSEVLTYQVPVEPIEVSKFAGIYKPSATVYDSVSEIGVYANGNGYLVINGKKESYRSDTYPSSSYNTKTNTLSFGNYDMTINLGDDGLPVSIVISLYYSDDSSVYSFDSVIGEEVVVPTVLHDIAYNKNYVGNSYTLYQTSSYVFLNDVAASINDYEKQTGDDGTEVEVYEIYVSYPSSATYKLVVKPSDNDVVMELYNTSSELIDTLVSNSAKINELNLGEFTINKEDFKNAWYFVSPKTAGWYKLTWTDSSLYVYSHLSQSNPSDFSTGKGYKSGDAIYLAVGDIIGFNNSGMSSSTQSVTINVAETEPLYGLSEDLPMEVVDGKATINNFDSDAYYYYVFTAPSDGDYLLSLSYKEWGKDAYKVHYVIGGVDYGYEYISFYYGEYYGDMSEENHYARLTLTAGQEILIVADRKGAPQGGVAMSIEVAKIVPSMYTGKYTIENPYQSPDAEETEYIDCIVYLSVAYDYSTVTYSVNGVGGPELITANLTDNKNGTYSFEAVNGDAVTFTVVNGVVTVVKSDFYGEATVTKSTQVFTSDVDTLAVNGSLSSLEIGDSVSGVLIGNEGGDAFVVTITKTADNEFTLSDENEQLATLVLDGYILTVNHVTFGEYTLVKQY